MGPRGMSFNNSASSAFRPVSNSGVVAIDSGTRTYLCRCQHHQVRCDRASLGWMIVIELAAGLRQCEPRSRLKRLRR